MLSINTNLSNLLMQKSLKESTNLLNQAVERMTTGFKINGAKDNAANHAIVQQMNTQLSSLDVAEDNTATGLDLVTTANDNLDLINERFERLRNLAMQIENETYGAESKSAINVECEALVEEIKNLYRQAEFNGMKIYGAEFFETVPTTPTEPIQTFANTPIYANANTTLQELGIDYSSFEIYNSEGGLIESYDTEKSDTLQDIFDVLSNYGFNSSITDGVISITSSSGRYVTGDLMEKFGINLDETQFVESSKQNSDSAVYYTTTVTASESSTFADMGVLTSGTDTVTIKDKFGDVLTSFNVNSSTTLGGLFNQLGNYDIQGEVDDGVITLSSSKGNYVVSNGVISSLGIGLNQSTSAVTTGTTQSSAGVVTYESITMSGGEVTTTQQEVVTTIYTTTTTSQTVTNTIWTTTTTSQTYTETIWTTNTTSTTQTSTIWTTTTTSETVTETINVSMTVGTTQTSTAKVTYEKYTIFSSNTINITVSQVYYDFLDYSGTISITPTYCETVSDLLYLVRTTLSEDGFQDTYNINSMTMVYFFDYKCVMGNGSWSYAQIYIDYVDENGNSYVKTDTVDGSEGYVTITADTTTRLFSIGITSTQYITVMNEGTQTTISCKDSDTIGSVVAKLTSAGLTASFSSGKLTVTGDEDTYIVGMSSTLRSKLKLNTNYNTLISTTTVIQTETEIVTTTSNAQTETVWNTTTTSTTQTNTIYTTTTSSTTNTSTVWNTTTSSTTNTETIDVTTTTPIIYTTANVSITSDTTFSELGLSSRSYITVMKDDTKTIITLKTADTVQDLVTKLNSSGITTTLNNGQLTLSPNSKSKYISGMSDSLIDIFKLESDFYTSSLGMEMTDSNLLVNDDAVITINQSTSLSEIGVTSGELVVKQDGNDDKTIAISESQSVADFVADLQNAGFNASCVNGAIKLSSNGDRYLASSSTNSSNAVSIFGLNNVEQEIGVSYANTNSDELNKVDEIVNVIWKASSPIRLQIGTGSDEHSRIEIETGFTILDLDKFARIGKNMVNKIDFISELDVVLNTISEKQVELGAYSNRLESVLEEISIKYDNLVSSRSTLRDADIAEESAIYIQQQILQQAAATLMATTANQTPQLALQLI